MSQVLFGEPLLTGGSAQAARGFVDAFRATLGAAASDAAALQAVVQRSPSADAARAIEASRHMLEGAAALRATADSAVAYTQRVPDVGTALNAAQCVLTALDAMLDGVETRLQEQYGIAPVRISIVKEELRHREEEILDDDKMEAQKSNLVYGTPSSRTQNIDTAVFTAQTFTPISSLRRRYIPANQSNNIDFGESPSSRPQHVGTAVFPAQTFTPKSAPRHGRILGNEASIPSSPEEMPSTPNMREFGIDGSALEGLKAAVAYRQPSAQNQDRHLSRIDRARAHAIASDVEQLGYSQTEPTIDEFVRQSIRALHIQTPVQVADRFNHITTSPPPTSIETPQQIAARFPLVPPTPGEKPTSHRRTIEFLDTPEIASVARQTRSRSKRRMML
jgi:hypothetical protein